MKKIIEKAMFGAIISLSLTAQAGVGHAQQNYQSGLFHDGCNTVLAESNDLNETDSEFNQLLSEEVRTKMQEKGYHFHGYDYRSNLWARMGDITLQVSIDGKTAQAYARTSTPKNDDEGLRERMIKIDNLDASIQVVPSVYLDLQKISQDRVWPNAMGKNVGELRGQDEAIYKLKNAVSVGELERLPTMRTMLERELQSGQLPQEKAKLAEDILAGRATDSTAQQILFFNLIEKNSSLSRVDQVQAYRLVAEKAPQCK